MPSEEGAGPVGVQVLENEWADENPLSRHAPPITLIVPAKRMVGWELERAAEVVQQGEWWHPQQTFVRKGNFTFTLDLPAAGPDSKVKFGEIRENISLVPYGCAKLRITTFPRVKDYA